MLRDCIQVAKESVVSMQIIPDRFVKAANVHDLARAFHELYTAPLDRVQYNKGTVQYRPLEHLSYDIALSPESVKFYLTVPERWNEYARNKITVIWPHATIKEGAPNLPSGECVAATKLTLKNHNFFALWTDRKDYKPLPALLEAAKDLKPGDSARIQFIITPADRQVWEYEATEAYIRYKQNKPLNGIEWTPSGMGKLAIETLDGVMKESYELVADVLGMKPGKKQDNLVFSRDLLSMALKNQRGITESSIRKIKEPVFAVGIRVIVAASDRDRADFAVKSISTAFNELASTDNEFEMKRIANIKAFANDIIERRPPIMRSHYSILGASELGKLMQLPGAELQDQYPAVERIALRETNLPAAVTTNGLWFGAVRYLGNEFPVYIPTTNYDELCLPRIVIGGMGTGKTKGFGGNTVVQAVKNGFGAVAIDPARGELGDEVESMLLPEQVVRIRFGVKPIAIDWREAKHGERARNRLANEIISFVEAAADDAGPQTIKFLRAAAKAVPEGRLSEVVSLLMDETYRRKILPCMREQEADTWRMYESMSEARRNQIALPVLNRLDVITGDDYLAECLDAQDGIDLVELIDAGPRAIILDIPKSELGTEGVDVLASLMATKLDLAMVMRKTVHPVLIVQDEPHQYMRSARTWRAVAVESRKWRFGYNWLFHSWEQIPGPLAEIIKSAGPHYHIYTSSKRTYKDLAEELQPFTLEECMETPTHWALNVIRANGVKVPTFLAKMAAPPSMQK